MKESVWQGAVVLFLKKFNEKREKDRNFSFVVDFSLVMRYNTHGMIVKV